MQKLLIILGVFLIYLPCTNYSFISLDTVSIKGDINFDKESISGDFFYTLKNNSNKIQKEWTVLIHSSVNILSINQNNKEAHVDIKQGFGYRVLTIKFPEPLKMNKRTSIFIKFTIHPQHSDPRFTISSNFVFLDARRLWFPFPDQDFDASYNITITTPKDLYSIMGGNLITDTIILNERIADWTNELDMLSLGATLVITDKKRIRKDDFNIYTDDIRLAYLISQKLTPYWNLLQKKHKHFPLSEIHILPIDISIPQESHNYADGEFLGTLILLDQDLIDDALNNPNTNFYLAGPANYRLTETLIHELYHSYFPGILKHQADEYLFIESFVQYLTWSLIDYQDMVWGQFINHRTRFILQNMNLSEKRNPTLWHFLLDTAVLHASLQSPYFNSFSLVDTLIEKYRFIELTKKDIQDTADQFYGALTNENPNTYPQFITLSKNAQLYNSSLQTTKTNFNITITNQYRFKKDKVITIPVQTIFLIVEHDYPQEWYGNLSWIANNKTNCLPIRIPPNTIWETNLIGTITQIAIHSPLDILDTTLSDNIMIADPLGNKIINSLNHHNTNEISLEIDPHVTNIIQQWRKNNYQLVWDHTIYQTNSFIIQAFLLDGYHTNSFIFLEGYQEDSLIKISNIQHP